MSRLFHLLASHDSPGTGVPRFSGYFKRAFPEVINVTLKDLSSIEWKSGDVVVTDNHLSVRIPQRVQTIVVHHGCAPYHYEVDPTWRSPGTEQIAIAQRLMFHIPNRIFVAPSAWVAEIFKKYATPNYNPLVLPHWTSVEVDPTSGLAAHPQIWDDSDPVVVIGDWRNFNKGKTVVDRLKKEIDGFEFRPLNFSSSRGRWESYCEGDVYLCLSLSEGSPYSVADAESMRIPIATTEVGNIHEFKNTWRIEDRESVSQVRNALFGAWAGRDSLLPSFFEEHTFESWRDAWKVVTDEAGKGGLR